MSITSIQGNYGSTFRNTGYNNNGFTTNTIYPNSIYQPSDSVEISGKDKGFSKTQKCGIGLAAAGVLAAAVLLMRGKAGAANKEIKALAEHIDFAPAKTAEEAINFAKTNLGIKKYSKDIPLDVMNWVNEGLVNVNNAAKGKAKMCKEVSFESSIDLSAASMHPVKEILNINKDFITNLDKTLRDGIDTFVKKKILFKNSNNKFDFYNTFYENGEISDNLLKKINKFTENPEVSFSDKIELFDDICSFLNARSGFYNAPMSKLKQLLKNEKITKVLLAHGKLPDLKQIEKLTIQQQKRVLVDLMNTCLNSKDRINFCLDYSAGDKFSTIYHEMGHLQHWISAGKDFFKMDKPEQCKKIFGKVSDITKDFINSQEKQQIANRVSSYAPTSPLEFVAEVYSKLISKAVNGGEKLSDDVMKLYAEYKGPSL